VGAKTITYSAVIDGACRQTVASLVVFPRPFKLRRHDTQSKSSFTTSNSSGARRGLTPLTRSRVLPSLELS
jgi:hypothetical protein